MSKLADAIRRTQRTESAPMGFGAARSAPKATMLVGFVADKAADATKSKTDGADVVLLDSQSKVPAPGDAELLKAKENGPVGVWGPVSGGSNTVLQEAGVDFLVFDPETTPASALLNEDIGYVLELPSEPEELYLRSLQAIQLDALYMKELPVTLTVARQIELQRVTGLAGKPLMCPVKADIGSEELQCLRAAGVAVLLLSGDTADIAKLKETVLALPARRARKDDRAVVTLPRGQAVHEHDDDEDE